MPDFDVQVTAGATLRPWKDPVGPNGEPSRIRPHPGQPQLYWEGHANVPVTLTALVDNIVDLGGGSFAILPPLVGPPDIELGGRLFTPFMAEGIGPPFFSSAPGLSSVVTFTPISGGHYCIGLRRPNGGAVLVHLDIGAAV